MQPNRKRLLKFLVVALTIVLAGCWPCIIRKLSSKIYGGAQSRQFRAGSQIWLNMDAKSRGDLRTVRNESVDVER